LTNFTAENYVSKEALQTIMNGKTKTTILVTGKHGRSVDLVKDRVDVDFVARLERKNNSHIISNKTFDFSKTIIRQPIPDGYNESKEQMKSILIQGKG